MDYDTIVRELAEELGIRIEHDGTIDRLDSLVIVNFAIQLEQRASFKFDIDALTEMTFSSVEAISAAMRMGKHSDKTSVVRGG